jgi:hypothetical protein
MKLCHKIGDVVKKNIAVFLLALPLGSRDPSGVLLVSLSKASTLNFGFQLKL